MKHVRKSNVVMAIAFFVASGICTPVMAEKKPELRFSRVIDLPGANLRMPVMAGASEMPAPSPKTYTYTVQQGAEISRLDCYLPRELWQLEQTAGQWIDESGNKLTVGIMKCPRLKAFPREHVPKAAFQEAYAAATNSATVQEWSEEMVRDWASEFTTLPVQSKSASEHFSNLKDLVFLSSEQRANSLSFAFRLNRNAAALSRASDNWYFMTIELNKQISSGKAREIAMANLIPKITTCSTSADRAGNNGPSGKFQNEKSLHTGKRTPEFTASREGVANSIRNMKDWWYVETDNYILLSNLKTKNRTMVRQLQTDIEYLRDACEQFMPPRVDINAVSVIRIFEDRKDYEAYVPGQFAWSSGLWMGDKRELVIQAAEWANKREAQQSTIHTIYHEAFHQYLFYAYDMIESSVWFNEGMAELYGSAAISEQRLRVEENKYTIANLEAAIADGRTDLSRLVKMSYQDFYGGDEKNREANYATAWGLVYFLMKAAPLEKPAKYDKIIQNYADALWATKDGTKASQKAFENTNMDELQKDFVKFWKSQSKRASAKRNDIFKAYSGTKK